MPPEGVLGDREDKVLTWGVEDLNFQAPSEMPGGTLFRGEMPTSYYFPYSEKTYFIDRRAKLLFPQK